MACRERGYTLTIRRTFTLKGTNNTDMPINEMMNTSVQSSTLRAWLLEMVICRYKLRFKASPLTSDKRLFNGTSMKISLSFFASSSDSDRPISPEGRPRRNNAATQIANSNWLCGLPGRKTRSCRPEQTPGVSKSFLKRIQKYEGWSENEYGKIIQDGMTANETPVRSSSSSTCASPKLADEPKNPAERARKDALFKELTAPNQPSGSKAGAKPAQIGREKFGFAKKIGTLFSKRTTSPGQPPKSRFPENLAAGQPPHALDNSSGTSSKLPQSNIRLKTPPPRSSSLPRSQESTPNGQ